MLEPIEIANGIFSLLFISISLFVGIRISSKYIHSKENSLIYYGIGWISLTIGWYPTTISFLSILITGKSPLPQVLFFIGIFFIPILSLPLIYVVSDLIYHKKAKYVALFYAIVGVIFEIIFVYFLIIDYKVIGKIQGVDLQYKTFVIVYLIFLILSVLIIGSIFSWKCLKSDQPETRLKGKFLWIAFISFVIGAIIDATFELTFIILTIARLILISSSIEFYLGFFLHFKKEKQTE